MRLLSLCILHIALVVTGELYIYDMIISCLELACQDKRLSCYSIKATIFSTLHSMEFTGFFDHFDSAFRVEIDESFWRFLSLNWVLMD